MRRREFIALLSGTAAWPLAVRAQRSLPTIGLLGTGTASAWSDYIAAFVQRLRELGWIENRTVAIEDRWAEGHYDRLPTMAADLVQRRVTVILAAYLPGALAAKAATVTVPIVFISGSDPVESGLVATFNRPGANVTGVSVLSTPMTVKRLELLREMVPSADRIAIVVNPSNPNAAAQLKDFQAAASTLAEDLCG